MYSEMELIKFSVVGCPICGDSLQTVESGQNCQGCGSRARLRSLVPVVDLYLGKEISGLRESVAPLLGFAMTGAERKILASVFNSFKSVSLFGSYSADHETGVDARDLSRYASDSFSAVFGCLLFDYFAEHELALRQCFRVIAPGGVFLTHIAPGRLLEGDAGPVQKGAIKARPGYFEYLPEKTELPDVKVGRKWFADTMRRAGFQPLIIKVEDAVPGMASEWFVGVKPKSID